MSELRGVVGRLAAAIGDGDAIQWRSLPDIARAPHEKALAEQLRTIATIQSQRRPSTWAPFVATERRQSPLWWTALMVTAALQVVAATVAVAADAGTISVLALFQVALTLSFAAAGIMLGVVGRGDGRARALGNVYVLAAAAFAHPLIAVALPGSSTLELVLLTVQPQGFLPLAVWYFAREFPRAERLGRFDRAASRLTPVLAAVGAALTANAALWLWVAVPPAGQAWQWLWTFRRASDATAFWNVVFALMTPALAASLWRAHVAGDDERRRARVFLGAMALGFLPMFADGVLRSVVPTFAALMASASVLRGLIEGLVLAALLSVPFTTGYAVLAREALDVRAAVHGVLRRVLSKYVLMAVVAGALSVAIRQTYVYGYGLSDLLADPAMLTAAWLAVLALGLLSARAPLLELVARAGDRRRADYPRTLASAANAIVRGRTAREAAHEAARWLAETLAVPSVGIVARQDDGRFAVLHGVVPPLPAGTALLALLADQSAVNVSPGGTLFALLPDDDRAWLMRSRFDAVARIPASGREVAGIVGIGGAGSRVLSGPDLDFLAALAANVGLTLDRGADATGGQGTHASEMGAIECSRCGSVGSTAACACAAPVRPAMLPVTLAGKFHVSRRLGQGGMGVVYLGHDLHLRRPVALKTLPQTSDAATAAMLTEAAAMAAVAHPGLATIYSMESWRSTPVLVVEYLAGGTLADRLALGPLEPATALALIAHLADAMTALHGAGILHLDVKPSNIGFASDGTAKLLDFGVARLLARAGSDGAGGVSGDARADVSMTAAAGTPLYFSPEILNGSPPDATSDLWSTAVVALQAIAGAYPFAATSMEDLLRSARRGAPDWRRWRPLLEPAVARFFDCALHPDVAARPSSAADLAAHARAVAATLTDPQPAYAGGVHVGVL